jgi:hypothetical protein
MMPAGLRYKRSQKQQDIQKNKTEEPKKELRKKLNRNGR